MPSQQRISLDCDRTSFLECDRCILNLLRPYLMQTNKNNQKFSQEQQLLTQFKQILDFIGAIVLASDGQVQLVTPRAEQLLSQYCLPRRDPHLLPESLQYWFMHQIAQITFNEYVPSSCLPLQMKQVGSKLLVSPIPYRTNSQP